MEGMDAIDLTTPEMEEAVPATYVTFKKDNVYESKGILGEGTGKYITQDKKITTSVGEDKMSFVMTSLTAETAEIELNTSVLGIPDIPEAIEMVTVILTKQVKE